MDRRLIWMAPLALVTVVACAENGGGDAALDGETDTAQPVLATPGCQPSDRMPLPGRASPYDSATIQLDEGVAKICYGRPSLKGRTMIGGDAVPYDTLWRTGANEPTTVHVTVPATIAGIDVEPGSYSLYTVPRESGPWTLIVNRATSQWGHESQYTSDVRAEEVGRTEVEAESLDSPVEQLTFRSSGGGAVLEWQDVRVRIPIESRG